MSSQLFDAQLLGPDNTASHQQLVSLINTGKFTGADLPYVAHKYLNAFCNENNSNGRRRWAGIALAGMMRASAGVVQSLKKLPQGLGRIGAIILNPKESEERRIVAGLIVRQGLEAHIDFADFWDSDRVLHSVPNFPKDSNADWMADFQRYLDALSDLALTNMNTDAMVLYPISLSASDGFQWTGRSAVAVVERGSLAVIASDSTLSKFHFIDLPISHIKQTSLQQDSPHESQEDRSGYTMYNVIMELGSILPSYRLDSMNREASDFKVSFLGREDAAEFTHGLQDARRNLASTESATVEGVHLTAPSNNTGLLRRPSAQRLNARIPRANQGTPSETSDSGSGGTLDEPISSDLLKEKHRLGQQATQEKSNGKLPRISKTTKQKVIRPPSAPFKGSKARASKNAAPIVDRSDDEDEDESSHDAYGLRSTAAMRETGCIGTGKKAQRRRKAYAEDDDFDPRASKAKPNSTKRKRASSDADEDSQRTKKKIHTKPSNSSRPSIVNTTARKQKAKAQDSTQTASAPARAQMKQSRAQHDIQNEVSARHPLIGGLKKSKSPSKTTALTFKKPGQPASTPGRPRAQSVRTTPKPQTPAESRRDSDGLPLHMSSSTPRSQKIHEGDFGLGHTPADTEILSSNTKRVPASPHADSTAISGHADRDEVHREKYIGDLETAKNDPFKQRRQGVQKITSFTRKLTGESTVDHRSNPAKGESFSIPAGLLNDDVEVDQMNPNLASQPLPKHSPSPFKHHTQTSRQGSRDMSAHARGLNSLSTKTSGRLTAATRTETAQELIFEVARSTNTPQDKPNRARKEPSVSDQSQPVPLPASGKAPQDRQNAVGQRAQINDSVISSPREAIENTLPDATAQSVIQADIDGDTTLVEEEMDMFEQYGTKASDLRFRSSPPIPDSSSVRDGCSEESEQEPEASPPTSRADELEWEAALQPHQRALREELLRTSKRVVRHIVGNETAVTEITGVFADDGERLLDLLVERQSDESAEAFQQLKSKRQDLLNELSSASKNLKAQRKQIQSIV